MDNCTNGSNLIARQEVVKKYAEAFDICFRKEQEELEALFKKQFSDDIVEYRVRKLNAVFHTRLSNKQIILITEFLVQGGSKLENDIKLGNACERVVKDIATCSEKNCFSFATKYCSFLAPDIYPIYDAFVASFLEDWNNKEYFLVQSH